MTLSFKTLWGEEMGNSAGSPTHFVEKIWAGLLFNEEILNLECNRTLEHIHSCESRGFNIEDKFTPKLHTIREDKKDRWKVGSKIHFVINNRTPDRFQFAPVLHVTSIQKIEFSPVFWKDEVHRTMVSIDGVYNGSFWHERKILEGGRYAWQTEGLGMSDIYKLARNDGFDTLNDFFKFFKNDESKTYKIIHWIDLKY